MSPATVAIDLRHGGRKRTDVLLCEGPYFKNVNGWRFGFSHDTGTGACIFSASLWPRGRSSVEEDWHFLGQVCAALELPPTTLRDIQKQAEHGDPTRVFKTVWFEDGNEP